MSMTFSLSLCFFSILVAFSLSLCFFSILVAFSFSLCFISILVAFSLSLCFFSIPMSNLYNLIDIFTVFFPLTIASAAIIITLVLNFLTGRNCLQFRAINFTPSAISKSGTQIVVTNTLKCIDNQLFHSFSLLQ